MSDEHCCDMMQHAVQTDAMPVFYQSRFRTWVIEQQDGLGTRWQISYCPWRGTAPAGEPQRTMAR